MEHPYQDRFWNSADGLRLHYRDYPGREDRPPLLCLHGLTRNSRDFAGLAERYAGEWRVIAPDMRGRGDSDHAKDSSTYALPNYLADLELLLESEGIGRFVAIGTSMGGLLTMLLAATNRDRIVAALLNDVGPEVETGGIEHIRSYLGQQRSFPTWIHAARAIEEVQRASFPDNTIEDWLAAAKRSAVGRVYNLGGRGRINLRELAELVVAAAGRGSFRVRAYPAGRRKIDIGDYYADGRKIARELGWRPSTTIREAVRRTVEYYRQELPHYL